METVNLIYHFCVIAISITFFSLKISYTQPLIAAFLKFIGKVVPLFCMVYAVVQIFKFFGIV